VSTPEETVYSAQPINSRPISELESNPPATHEIVNPENPPWGVLSALITWFTSVVLLALVPNLCVLPYLAYHYRGVSVATREALLSDKTFVFLFVCGWLPAHLFTLVLVWAVSTRLGKLSLARVFGWNWSPAFGLLKSAGLATALFILAMLLVGLFGAQETDLDRILQSSRAAALTMAFIAVATAPLVEEMIYRGLLYSALQRAIGPLFAVIRGASMFAGMHILQYWPNAGAISAISLLSLVLTVVRARTGQLLPCFVIHLVFNGVQSLIIVFEPYVRELFDLWQHRTSNGALIYLSRFLG